MSALYLHIGHGKTGTSAIQHFLDTHREPLSRKGLFVPPSLGQTRHTLLSLYAKPDRDVQEHAGWQELSSRFGDTASVRRHIETCLAAAFEDAAGRDLVVSDEGLWSSHLSRLIARVRPHAQRIVVIAYLRRQDEGAISSYKQAVRARGRTFTLAEFLRREHSFRDYYARLKGMRRANPGVSFHVRAYDRTAFAGGSVVRDFNAALGTPLNRDDIVEPARDVYSSLDAFTTEWLRRRNIVHGPAPAALQRALSAMSDGPALRAPDADLALFFDRFSKSNKRLVREFLPEADALFCTPPRAQDGILQDEITAADLKTVDDRLAALQGQSSAPRRKG